MKNAPVAAPRRVKRLFVNYFEHSDALRRSENRRSLQRNLKAGLFDEVVVLAQAAQPAWVKPQVPLRWVDVTQDARLWRGRPAFELFFALANEALTGPQDLSVICNSDMSFDRSLHLLDAVCLEDVCLALSRHEDRGGKLALECWDHSQDTWIFQGRIRPLSWAGFPMGIYCCDWRLAWELSHAGYRVLNPCYSIITRHLHKSELRHPGPCIPGPHLNVVTRCRLEDCHLPPARPSRRGIICMSLWGWEARYLTGALRNAEMVRQLYPGWLLRIYHDDTVPPSVLGQLRALHVELVLRGRSEGRAGAFWRFEVADDPAFAVWAVRDADSRPSYRERRAVDAWLESGLDFHVMRDHPGHTLPVMSGAFGGRSGCVPMRELLAGWTDRSAYGDDGRFLAERVWPLVKDRTCVHEGDTFPVPREFGHFVQERVSADEGRHLADRAWLADTEAARCPASGGNP